MSFSGKIVSDTEVRFQAWEPEKTLPVFSPYEVQLSRGFLRANPKSWFPQIRSFWLPLLHTLEEKFSNLQVTATLAVPENLERARCFSVNGELGFLGIDGPSLKAISDVIAEGMVSSSQDLLLEYLERRFLSSLSLSWAGKDSLEFFYEQEKTFNSVSPVGALKIEFTIHATPVCFWVGVGENLANCLDVFSRKQFVQPALEEVSAEEASQEKEVSIQLLELSVPPVQLIEYMRSGTVVDLEIPVSSKIGILLDGEIWGRGNLGIFDGNFAVQVTETSFVRKSSSDDMTSVQILFARTAFRFEELLEYQQSGVLLETQTPLSSNIELSIGGEVVAEAVLGQIENRFALNILPK